MKKIEFHPIYISQDFHTFKFKKKKKSINLTKNTFQQYVLRINNNISKKIICE